MPHLLHVVDRDGLCPLSGMTFNFHITNKGIWPFYKRLSFARSGTDFYRAFSSTYKGGLRKSPEEPSELEVSYPHAVALALPGTLELLFIPAISITIFVTTPGGMVDEAAWVTKVTTTY